ncbi:hypothetical protein HPB48_001521 [Haemaphysalis longicornis]|uniref:Fibronectin type-III domain-containing protein n=1 Tax=Haemaphysalis longicornis TaxID=44386 RepID=A0A9J6H0Z1_HAELO|nr:hypothetical protein HPB48_001521 [Haemaphysalis longicornis]
MFCFIFSTVRGRQLVKIETVNSSSILVRLNAENQRQENFKGVKITWSPSKPSPGASKPEDTVTVFVPSNQSTFVITGLLPFEHYTVAVAEVFGTSSSQWETVVSVSEAVTDPRPSPPPTEVTLKSTSIGSSSTLVVNWNAPQTSSGPPIEGYVVSVCPHTDGTSTTACRTFNTSASSSHVEVSGLRSFAEYDIEVKAYVTINGRVVTGDVTRTVVSTNAPPLPPIEGAAVRKSLEGGSVRLSWKRPDQVQGLDVVYVLVLAEKASGMIVSRTEVNVTETSFEGLVSSVDYVVSITICLVSESRRQCGNATDVTFKAIDTGEQASEGHPHFEYHGMIESSLIIATLRHF